MKPPIAAITCCLLFFAVFSQSQVYRWVDENGKVHFSDRKPSDKKADDISKDVKKTNIDTSSSETEKMRDVFVRETPEEKANRELEARQQAVKRKSECKRARYDLRISTAGGGMYVTNEDGSRRFITEEERDVIIKRAKKVIARNNCK